MTTVLSGDVSATGIQSTCQHTKWMTNTNVGCIYIYIYI